jgi:exonuclease VII small subunit
MSTDDWRAVDWAKKKIEELESDLSGTDKAVMTLNERLSKLERTVGAGWDPEDEEVESSLFDLVRDLEKKVRAEKTLRRVVGLENQMKKLHARFERDAGDDMAQPWEIWAEIQLKKMGGTLERLLPLEDVLHNYVPEAAFEDLVGRVRRLESQTEFETSEDDTRILALEKRFNNHFNVDAAEYERRLDSLEILVRELRNQGAQLQQSMRAYGVPEVQVGETLERTVFSSPIGLQGQITSQYERGLKSGAEKALEYAELRLRKVLEDMGWHENSPAVKTMVDALYGR